MLVPLALLCLADEWGPPAPFGPIPSPAQSRLYQTGLKAWIRFGTSTFCTSKCSPNSFNPTAIDPDQWVIPLQEAGFSEIVLTIRTRDGFCLWKSKSSQFSLNQSLDFQQTSQTLGQSGDVLTEFSKSCVKHGVRVGVAFSKLDSSLDTLLPEVLENKDYGTPDGFSQVILDPSPSPGQCAKTDKIRERVQQLHPQALFTSPCGDAVRRVRKVPDPFWARINSQTLRNYVNERGETNFSYSDTGDESGNDWLVGEVEVNLGNCLYWRDECEPIAVRELVNAFFASVGRGQTMVLNVPPSRAGIIEQPFVDTIRQFGLGYRKTFNENLLANAEVSACSFRRNSESYHPMKVLSQDSDGYWTMNDDERTGWIVIDLKAPTVFDIVEIREHVVLGQRVKRFVCQAKVGGHWMIFESGKTIGPRRLLRREPVKATHIRLLITESLATPAIAFVGVYKAAPNFEVKSSFPEGIEWIPITSIVQSHEGWEPEGKGMQAREEQAVLSFLFKGTMLWIVAEGNDGSKLRVEIDRNEVAPFEPVKIRDGLIIFPTPQVENDHHEGRVICTSLPLLVKGVYKLDNRGAGMIQFENDVYTITAGTCLAIPIQRIGGADVEVRFKVETVQESAEPEKDFLPEMKEFVMGVGEMTKTITVKTLSSNDRRQEVSFYLELSDPSGGAIIGFRPIAQVRIVMAKPYRAGYGLPAIAVVMDHYVTWVVLMILCCLVTMAILGTVHRHSRVVRSEFSRFIRPAFPNNNSPFNEQNV